VIAGCKLRPDRRISPVGAGSPATAQTLRIYQIDVEQPHAALLVMLNGKTRLIRRPPDFE
jgi:hypothetical protein